MQDRILIRSVGVGVACALFSILCGSSGPFWTASIYWMLGSTGVAFSLGAAVRDLMDGPDMYPRSMTAIARAAEDRTRSPVYRRTAVALYLYMTGMLFCAGVFCTIPLVSFIFFRS